MKKRFILQIALCLLLSMGYAYGDDSQMVRGHVIQIARETVYVNLGRKQHVVIGQILRVMHSDQVFARLRVVRLADGFSACEVVSASGALKADDPVLGEVAVAQSDSTFAPADSTERTPPISTPPPSPAGETASAAPRRPQTQFRGRVALRYRYMNDQSPTNRDTYQPEAQVSLSADQIGGTPLAFLFRMRASNYHVHGRQPSFAQHPDLRLYDLALSFGSDRTRYGFGIGRLNPVAIAGVGEFDGALLTVQVGPGLRAGVFGGFQPDLETSDFTTQVSKTGVFLNFQRGSGSGFAQNGTIAFAGQYRGGTVAREFVYLQDAIQLGRHVFAYQHAEVDLDRTNRSAQMKPLQLTNLYTNVRWSPSSTWSVGVGYDARKYLPLPLEGTVVDSLLDTAFRQGLQADVGIRPLRFLYLYARGNFQLRQGERATKAFSTGFSASQVPGIGMMLRSRFTVVNSAFSQARDMGVGIGRGFGRLFYVDVDLSRYRSKFTSTDALAPADAWDTRRQVSTSLQIYLPRRSFLMIEHDIYRGALDYTYTFAELGLRF